MGFVDFASHPSLFLSGTGTCGSFEEKMVAGVYVCARFRFHIRIFLRIASRM
jgi:hypothetical protein